MSFSGLPIFFTNKEQTLFVNLGRELVEGLIQQWFTLYRIDVSNTESNFYGESKTKNFLEPKVVKARIEITDSDVILEGGTRRVSKGDMIAHVYDEYMSENDFDINHGDFISHQGKWYEVFDAGYNLDAMETKFAGDRDYYRRILATAVKGEIFSGRT